MSVGGLPRSPSFLIPSAPGPGADGVSKDQAAAVPSAFGKAVSQLPADAGPSGRAALAAEPTASAPGTPLADRKAEPLASAAGAAAPEQTSEKPNEATQAVRLGKVLQDPAQWAGQQSTGRFALADLAQMAKGGNLMAARSMLHCFQPGSKHELTERQSREIRRALVAVYSHSGTPEAIKAQIANDCGRYIDQAMSRQRSLGTQKERNDQAPATRKTLEPLLEIAISCRRLHPEKPKTALDRQWSELGKRLDVVGAMSGDPPEDVLNNTRYMRQDEVRAGVKDLKAVPVLDGACEIAVPLLGGSDNLRFFAYGGGGDGKSGPPGGSAQSALAMAKETGKPVGLTLNLGGRHWVYLAVFPPTTDKQVPCLLFDSLKNVASTHLIESALKKSLQSPEAFGGGSLRLALKTHGGSLQDHAKNTCGAFTTRAAVVVDEACQSGVSIGRASGALDALASAHAGLKPDEQATTMVPIRARGLADSIANSC